MALIGLKFHRRMHPYSDSFMTISRIFAIDRGIMTLKRHETAKSNMKIDR